MMKYFLENENIKISTDTFGGELNNLFSKKTQLSIYGMEMKRTGNIILQSYSL